jgi:hypothetical protein
MKRYLFLIFFVGFSSCAWFEEDLEAQLPPMTQHGANTFACIFDGEIFQPNNSKSGFMGMGVRSSGIELLALSSGDEKRSIRIQANRYQNAKNLFSANLYLYEFYVRGVGLYNLNTYYSFHLHPTPEFSFINIRAKSPKTGIWETYASFEGSGEIRIVRSDTKGVSGTFHAYLKSKEGTETVRIEHGRFDVDYSTYSDVDL